MISDDEKQVQLGKTLVRIHELERTEGYLKSRIMGASYDMGRISAALDLLLKGDRDAIKPGGNGRFETVQFGTVTYTNIEKVVSDTDELQQVAKELDQLRKLARLM